MGSSMTIFLYQLPASELQQTGLIDASGSHVWIWQHTIMNEYSATEVQLPSTPCLS